MRIPSGVTDQVIFFVAVDSTDLKTRETGLTTFTVYRARDTGAATAMTTPTVAELSAANMPGVYSLLLDEDMTIAAGNDSEEMVFHITQAAMAPVTRTIELYRPKITAGETVTAANGAADADIERLQGSVIATPTVAGVLEVDVTHWIGTAAATPTVAGVPEVDITHFNGTAGTFAAGRPEVNTSHVGGTLQTAGDIIGDTNDIQARLPAALVGGRIDASVGAMAAGVVTAAAVATGAIDADALAADAATEIRSLASGTADSGTATTMVDAARTEADADYWKGQFIAFTSGTLLGQTRLITAFDPATDTITFAPATTVAVGTHTYEILPNGRADVGQWLGVTPNVLIGGRVDADVGAMQTNTVTAAAIATDAIDADAIAASAIGASELAAGAITAAKFAAGAIDAAAIATGAIDADAIAADAITATKIANGAIDAATFAAGAIDAAAIGTAAIDADALAVSAVEKILQSVGGTADSTTTTTVVDAERTEADTDYWKDSVIVFTAGPAVGQMRRISAFNAATDTLTVDTAFTASPGANTYIILRSAMALAAAAGSGDWTTAEKEQIRDALGIDGTKTAATGGDVQDLQARLPAALVAGRIDSSVGAMAANTLTASALAADAVDEILDDVIEGTTTLRQMLRGFASALLSKLSGAGTGTEVFRDIGDTKARITATVDASGNRTAITLDLT